MNLDILREAAARCRATADSLDQEIIAPLAEALTDPAVPSAAKADFLRALAERGERADEVAAFAKALLPRAENPGMAGSVAGRMLYDCCGPGGGHLPMVNISTGSVFLLAAAGVPVVKHGNRGVTKASGSSDVLTALGIGIEVPPAKAAECLAEVGAAFLFAPLYHPAFRHVAEARKLLAAEGRRTVFNLVAPLLNPARPDAQLIGVFEAAQLECYDGALEKLGRKRRAVVLGRDAASGRPLGEVSVLGANECRGNVEGLAAVTNGMPEGGRIEELLVGSAAESAARLEAALRGEERGLLRAMLIANAAAGLVVAGRAAGPAEARAAAEEALDSGGARQVLARWRRRCPAQG